MSLEGKPIKNSHHCKGWHAGRAGSRQKDRVRFLELLPALVLVIISVLAAGGAHAERPAWLDHPAVAYPPSDYLIGLGDGITADEAIAHARADLAASFLARVRSVTTFQDDVEESFNRERNTYEKRTRSERVTEVEAEECLSNITLGATWFDEATGQHHALMYVRRREAEQIIGADIQAKLSRISELLDCDACYQDVLAEYAGAHEAAVAYGEYEDLCAQLRVVTEGRDGAINAPLGAQVAAWASSTSKRLTLEVESAPGELAADLRDCLLSAGFKIVERDGRFIADLDYVTTATTYTQPYVFEAWELTLRIRRRGDGSDLIALDKRDRSGHKSQQAAQERCLRAARKALAGEFLSELKRLLTGERPR